jgi:serine O-acetyltransferase
MPSPQVVAAVTDDLLQILFPGYFGDENTAGDPAALLETVATRLQDLIVKALRCTEHQHTESDCAQKAEQLTSSLLSAIPSVRELLVDDIAAAYDRDPAATSHQEVVLAYPAIVAIAVHRLAHVMFGDGVPLIPRVMSEYAHSRTGIDIHPGAKIGHSFFIDHGTGVVIGETAEIGSNVTLYQGVTLGASNFPRDGSGRAVKGAKRHPQVEDNVTIYSGASILGNVVIGAGSVIGGNVWLTHSIPPDTTVLISVPQEIRLHKKIEDYRI